MGYEYEGDGVVKIGNRTWVVSTMESGTTVATPAVPIVCILGEDGWRPARLHDGVAIMYGGAAYPTLQGAAAVHDVDPSENVTEIHVKRSDTRLGADMLVAWIAICLINTVWQIEMMDAVLGTLMMFFFTIAHDVVDEARARR